MTTLVVIRGNSGSGKSSVAREVRRRYGRGCALIEQDHLRRIMLREHDTTDFDGLTPQLIGMNARLALANGYHVVLEGILFSGRYGGMLRELVADHPGRSHVYYLDVSLDETIRRHATRPQAADFTAEQMRAWYAPRDVLGLPGELVVDESSTFAETVETILHTSALRDEPVTAPCPTRCPRCQEKAGRSAQSPLS
ncbi:kinase [Micromonosporaceae bacterium Da 78-11]